MMRLWERHLLKEVLKVFSFCLGAIYILYALIDYSTHMQDFVKNSSLSYRDLGFYYLHQFLKRADLLLPLSLIVATIKVFLTLNTRFELLALHMAGISARRLTRPLFIVGCACTLFNYCNSELFSPQSLNFLDTFDKTHFKHSHKGKRKEPFHIFALEDGSSLVYQYHDPEHGAFFDVFWIRSHQDVWHMKYLYPSLPLKGTYVDHLIRDANGVFTKESSLETRLFDELPWNQTLTDKGPVPFENRSLNSLCKLYFAQKTSSLSMCERTQVLSQILIKFLMPILPLLIICAIVPFCMRYHRSLPTFFIYTLSLFGFLALFTCMDAAVILSESQLISPYIAILVPFTLFTLVCYGNYRKLKN